MKKWRLPLRLLALLLAGAAVGYALLLAVYLLPTEPLARNVRASLPALNGDWGLGEESYQQLVKGYLTTQLDNSTDAVMMLTALHDCDAPLTERAVEAYSYSDAVTAYETLLKYARTGPEGMGTVSTARYWHGYLVFLKPLLSVMSYLDIRALLMAVQGAMLAGVAAGMGRRGLGRYVWAFALALVCVTPAVTGFSLQFSTTLTALLACMLVLLYARPGRWDRQALCVLFLLCGMATSYVDYLTYPLAAFGVPFVLAVLLAPEKSPKREWTRLLACGACWALGYFGLWACKWLLAMCFGNEAWFLPNLIAKITERGGATVDDAAVSVGSVLGAQLGVFAKRAYFVVAVAAALGYAFAWLRARKNHANRADGRYRWVLCAVALLPFAWYCLTRNHSYQHAFFTSRSLSVTVFALAAALTPGARAKASCRFVKHLGQ